MGSTLEKGVRQSVKELKIIMRQNITKNQLMELTEEQRNKLREWWKPEIANHVYVEHDWHYRGSGGYENVLCNATGQECECLGEYMWTEHKDFLSPLLSIGQMIEFLDGHNSFSNTALMTDDFGRHVNICGTDLVMSWDSELVDCLWEAVKEVLK